MNFRFRHFGFAIQKIEIATLMRLRHAIGVERHVSALIARRRFYPFSPAAG